MDQNRFAFSGKYAGSPIPENDTLVVDLGTHSIQLGFLGEDEPRYVMRTAVSKSRNKNSCFRMGNEMTEADFVRRTFRSPFVYGGKEQGQWKGGLLLHYELVQNILEYMLSFALPQVPNDSQKTRKVLDVPVFVAIPYCTPRLSLIILADIFLNYFGATSVSFAPSELCFSSKNSFQIVLHLGYSCTTAYPLFYSATRQTFSIPSAHLIKVLPVGMQAIQLWLLKFLNTHYPLFTHLFTNTFIEYVLSHVCVALSIDTYHELCAEMLHQFSKCKQHKESLFYQETRYSDLSMSMDAYNCYLQVMESLSAKFPEAYVHPKGHSNMIHTGILLIELFEGARQNELLQARQSFIVKARRATLNKLIHGVRDHEAARLLHGSVAELNALQDTCSYGAEVPEEKQARSTTLGLINARISRSSVRNVWANRQRARSRTNRVSSDEKETSNLSENNPLTKHKKKSGSDAFKLDRADRADSDADSDADYSNQPENDSSIVKEENESDEILEAEAEEETDDIVTSSTDMLISTEPLTLPSNNTLKSELDEPEIKHTQSINTIRAPIETSRDVHRNVLDRSQAVAILTRLYTRLKAQLQTDRYNYNNFCTRKNIDLLVDTAIEFSGFTSMEKLSSAKVIRQLHTYLLNSTEAVDMVVLKLAELGINIQDLDKSAAIMWPYISHPAITYKKCVPGYFKETCLNNLSLNNFLEVNDPKTLRVCLFLFNEHIFPSQMLFYPRLMGSSVSGIGDLVLSVARETNNYLTQTQGSSVFSAESNVLTQWNKLPYGPSNELQEDQESVFNLPQAPIELLFIGGGSGMHNLPHTLLTYLNAQSGFTFRVTAEDSKWERFRGIARLKQHHIIFTLESLAMSVKGIPKRITEKATK
ncbi:Actin related protein [Giardia lamblia P15]|uniref:Actin related protein n=1 Tax=Giardia intestinalis (strain P15) TaxID=658858 RepID=E1F030_GIAIA|nr:Actin related protein [Giardia lamblia P15]